MSETLARIFLARLLPGETPTLFKGSHLTMQLARQRVGVNDKNTRDMEVNGGSFILPDLPFMNNDAFSFIDRSVSLLSREIFNRLILITIDQWTLTYRTNLHIL